MTKFDYNINIHDAKTHLSRYLNRVREGQIITLCKNGKPIAQIIPFKQEKGDREFGLAKGLIEIPDSFYDELTDDDFPGIGL